MLVFFQLLSAAMLFFVAGMHFASRDMGAPELNAWSWVVCLCALGLYNMFGAIGNMASLCN